MSRLARVCWLEYRRAAGRTGKRSLSMREESTSAAWWLGHRCVTIW
jgi:hypothetical protein